MLKRLSRSGPDIAKLLQRKDVPGLVQALQQESPEMVTRAAQAITTLHREGNAAECAAAEATAAALLDAFQRVCGRLGAADQAAAGNAGIYLIEALGEIRANAAKDELTRIVGSGASKEVDLRGVAMHSLAQISGAPLGPWFQGFLDDPERARYAALALLVLGVEGLRLLGEHLLTPARLAAGRYERGAAGNALVKTVMEGGIHAAQASAILAEVAAGEIELQRQAEERAAAEAGEVVRQHEALAAKLVALIGSPSSWRIAGRTITLGSKSSFEAMVERCRRLGLPIRDSEDSESNEVSHFWAEVDFEGETFVIDGLRRFRDV